ncbi:ferredoxin [Candidatus Micrarchaeota archaeon]|nr:ferredoxin [Candidatus Micrarchaeota archaeon]MBU1930388.1 ferredoxin [Candidatus Micrarchaeota archaeon]
MGKKYKIVYNRDACIGAASCIAVAPKTWKMGNDGKAIQLVTEFDEKDLQQNLDAARSCPVHVIKIVDTTGKEVA